jgi:hypothetical protein
MQIVEASAAFSKAIDTGSTVPSDCTSVFKSKCTSEFTLLRILPYFVQLLPRLVDLAVHDNHLDMGDFGSMKSAKKRKSLIHLSTSVDDHSQD